VKLNVACFILAAAVAAAATVAYMSKHSVLYHIDTILIQSHTASTHMTYIRLVMMSTTCWLESAKACSDSVHCLEAVSLWKPNRVIGHTAAQPMEV